MNRHQNYVFKFLVLVFSIMAFSCSEDPISTNNTEIPGLPEELDDGWPVLPMKFVGIDSDLILALSSRIAKGDFGDVHSFSIARSDYLIFDEYYGGHDVNELHRVYSVTKSVVSALIGIAIEQGHIEGVEQKIADFFSKYAEIFNADSVKQNLTLRHLLTMTAGFEWDELSIPYSDSRNSWNRMSASSDLIKYTLERPIVDQPGTKFVYNSGCTVVLGWILKQATGQHVDELAEEYLFKPLVITEYQWSRITVNDGMPHPASGLSLRPRDMAKIGKLYLDHGKWFGVPVIPIDWVLDSVSPRVPVAGTTYYGYQWWSFSYERIPQPGVHEIRYVQYAVGYGGQFILTVPVNDLVVVLTGSNGDESTNIYEILFNYILPAVTG